MKRALLVILISLIPVAVFAQAPDVSLTVSLAAAPAGQVNLGNPITLTATPTLGGKLTPDKLAVAREQHIRYTFSAQRTWPCPDTVSIASKVSTKSVTWTAQKAGIYQISVEASYVEPTLRPALTGKISRGSVATASLPNYKVLPAAGFSPNVLTDFSPPSPATAPVSLNLQVSIGPNPPEGRWYRYQYWCVSGCQPGTAVKDNQGNSVSFQMQIPNANPQIRFDIGVDKVRQSDCTWEQSIVTHANPYYYTVQ